MTDTESPVEVPTAHAVLEYLQMAIGYTLTGHTNEECLWYIHGPTRSSESP